MRALRLSVRMTNLLGIICENCFNVIAIGIGIIYDNESVQLNRIATLLTDFKTVDFTIHVQC